jgi:squalene monooxygenase
VSELLHDLTEVRVRGVYAVDRETKSSLEFHAPLTLVADGAFSKFRKTTLGTSMQASSYFVGLILEDVVLPAPNHGHVLLADPSPILLYQIGTHDTRILIDVPGEKPPSQAGGALAKYLETNVMPQLPPGIQSVFLKALQTQRLRVMPNPYLPSRKQGNIAGLILVGDAHNMRHPLTGGGMTVALSDALLISNLFSKSQFPDLAEISEAKFTSCLQQWHWKRKSLSAVVNILANALYALFAAHGDPVLTTLQQGCFQYLKSGGERTAAPVRLLSCLAPYPGLLVRHFFQVAAYSSWFIIRSEPWWALPKTLWKCVRVMGRACGVILPLMWYEVRGAPAMATVTSSPHE